MASAADVVFRDATVDDVPAVLALLADDVLGQARESADPALYRTAFRQMEAEGGNRLIVGLIGEEVIATCQLVFISGLSLRASRRAMVESVRVRADLRGQGIGEALMAEVEARTRDAGCSLIQLTSNAKRDDAARFYQRLGFTPSHIGFKRDLT